MPLTRKFTCGNFRYLERTKGSTWNQEETEMNLSKAIRVLMAEKDLAVAHVVNSTNWSESYVCSCRSGKADPQARLSEWAAVLGVLPSELIHRAESYSPREAA